MEVQVDEIWATEKMLHFRCIVHGVDGQWRQKRWASMPLRDVPDEVITAIVGHYMDMQPEEDHTQTALF